MKKLKKRGRKSTWTKQEEAFLKSYVQMRNKFQEKVNKIKAKLKRTRTNREIYNKLYHIK